MKQIITDIKRQKLAEATHTTGTIPVVKYIAVGDGGVDQDGEPIAPDGSDTQLHNELVRKEYTSSQKISDSCYEYTLLLGTDELVGKYISEIALVDAEDDIVAIATFYAKGKDAMEDTFTIQDLY